MTKDEIAEITKRCVSLSQLRESFVNLTLTRGYGKRKGEKDLSKLTHQVYIYAIPYLWAFPPHEQIFGTTAIVRATCVVQAEHRRPDHQELSVGRSDRGELRGQGPRRAHGDPDGCRQLRRRGTGLQRGDRQGRQDGVAVTKRLPGITRKTVFELADAMGIEATLRDVTSYELYDADELMAVTTAGGVTPIMRWTANHW